MKILDNAYEHITYLDSKIKSAEIEMINKIEHWGKNDKEYAREQTREYYAKIEPLRRERECVAKVITDYYALQTEPPMIVNKDTL